MAGIAVSVLPIADYRRERWRNGAGWTREIVRLCVDHEGQWRDAGARKDWQVRLSIADIESDCAFSAFPGIERELVLLAGDGIALDFADGRSARVEPRYGRARFAGDTAPNCRLLGGRTRDFNLMWQPQSVDAQLSLRPLVGNTLFVLEQATCWAVHLLAGQARFVDRPDLPALAAGDSAWLTSAGTAGAHIKLEGAGEALLVRLRRIGLGTYATGAAARLLSILLALGLVIDARAWTSDIRFYPDCLANCAPGPGVRAGCAADSAGS